MQRNANLVKGQRALRDIVALHEDSMLVHFACNTKRLNIRYIRAETGLHKYSGAPHSKHPLKFLISNPSRPPTLSPPTLTFFSCVPDRSDHIQTMYCTYIMGPALRSPASQPAHDTTPSQHYIPGSKPCLRALVC